MTSCTAIYKLGHHFLKLGVLDINAEGARTRAGADFAFEILIVIWILFDEEELKAIARLGEICKLLMLLNGA